MNETATTIFVLILLLWFMNVHNARFQDFITVVKMPNGGAGS